MNVAKAVKKILRDTKKVLYVSACKLIGWSITVPGYNVTHYALTDKDLDEWVTCYDMFERIEVRCCFGSWVL